MLDAFGLAQPTAAVPLLLGSRFGSVLFPIAVAEVLYAEFPMPGKLWQPGLPFPYRDGRLADGNGSPGVLGVPFALHWRCWGGGIGTGSIFLRIGPTAAVTQILSAGLFMLEALIIPTTWTTATVFQILTQTSSVGITRGPVTLANGFDVTQTASVTNAGDAANQNTIDGSTLYAIPAAQYSPESSIVESLMG